MNKIQQASLDLDIAAEGMIAHPYSKKTLARWKSANALIEAIEKELDDQEE